MSDGSQQIASALNLDTTSSTSATTATDSSPSTLIGAFADALQQYEAQPDSSALGTAAVTAAKALVSNLNQGSANVQAVREQADSAIATSVQTINSLLAQFQTVNTQITNGTKAGSDVSSALDTRDSLLKQLSSEIGITTVPTSSGGLSIYTDSGATLFETTARTVSFTPTSAFSAATVGNAVTVDGVPVTGSSAIMPLQSGRLVGLTTLRDQTTVDYQNQLDQMASSLVTRFAETDTASNGTTSTAPGLFTAAGLTGVPTSAQATGLAATLTVNAAADPTVGGVVTRLAGGNISDPSSTTNNPNGDAAYSSWLQQLTASLSQTQSFNASTGARPRVASPLTPHPPSAGSRPRGRPRRARRRRAARAVTSTTRLCRTRQASTSTIRCRRCSRSSTPIRPPRN